MGTAALGNTAQGTPFATGVDAFVYPQFIGYALRAPTTKDIENPGTRWQDNSVNPPVIYETSGNGLWNITTSGGVGTFTSLVVTPGPASITGTTTINTSGAGVTTIGTGGTGAVNIGNATGNTAVTGSLTASTGLTATAGGVTATAGGVTATAGNITATNGNVVINGAAKQLQVHGGAATDFIGTATLVAGTVTIANTNIAATDRIVVVRIGANGSTTLGILTYTISAATSFTVTSVILGTPASTQTADVSTIWYLIVRQV